MSLPRPCFRDANLGPLTDSGGPAVDTTPPKKTESEKLFEKYLLSVGFEPKDWDFEPAIPKPPDYLLRWQGSANWVSPEAASGVRRSQTSRANVRKSVSVL